VMHPEDYLMIPTFVSAYPASELPYLLLTP
jgi:hypothetical protein